MEAQITSEKIVPTLDEQNFESEVLRSAVPVLVDFSTEWCGPCKRLTPILHKLAGEHRGRLKVAMVDGDEQAAITARFGVRAFPTVIAFSGGKEVGRHVGLTSKERLLGLVGQGGAH